MLNVLLLITASSSPAQSNSGEDYWDYANQYMKPCQSKAKDDYPWIDRAHLLLSDNLCQQALWVDSFFGPESVTSSDLQSAKSMLSIQISTIFRERKGLLFQPRLQAAFKLPHAENRLQLLIEGEELKEDTESTNHGTAGSGQSSATVRYIAVQKNKMDLNFDIGARFRGGPFIRTRAQLFNAFGRDTTLKFTQDLTLEVENSWYELSRLAIDLFDSAKSIAYRYRLQCIYGEKSNGFEWRYKMARIKQLSTRSALSTFFMVEGATNDSNIQSENFRIGINYKKSFWRPWLTMSLEPQITFPRRYNYRSNYQFSAGVEIRFGKGKRAPYQRVSTHP